jgi:hypothetical protein
MRLIPVVVLVGLLGLAWADVNTGIGLIDALIEFVPIDWLKEMVRL